jgi:hypothetical protein
MLQMYQSFDVLIIDVHLKSDQLPTFLARLKAEVSDKIALFGVLLINQETFLNLTF